MSAAGACATTPSTRWTSCASSASTCGSTSVTATSRSAFPRASGDRRGRDPPPGGAAARPPDARPQPTAALGVRARVLPMADRPVRTRVLARGRWVDFQEFMVRERGAGPVDGVEYVGVEAASPPPAALEAIAAARAIVVGPSNPVISIRPILAVPGMAQALRDSPAPVVGVSPVVGGGIVKGPTEPFRAWLGQPLSAAGVAAAYGGLLDGMVADEPVDGLPHLLTDTLMADAAARRRVAEEALRFAESLSR